MDIEIPCRVGRRGDKMSRIVVFDLFGVVFSKGIASSITRLNAVFNRSEFVIRPIFQKCEKEFDLGNINENEFWKCINSELHTNIDSQTLTRIVLSGYKINPQVISLVARLRSKFLVIAFSNYRREWFCRLNKKFSISQEFNEIFISSDFGVLKPNPKVFTLIHNRFNIPKGNLILIDDEMKNIESANKFGAKGILFKNIVQTATDFAKFTSDLSLFQDEFYSGIILQTKNGSIVLQRRDDNPSIVHPAMLSVFGGRRLQGESAIDCAIREINEETRLLRNKSDLHLLGNLYSPIENNKWMECSYYLLTNVNPKLIELKEGKDFEIYWPQFVVEKDDVVLPSKVAIEKFILWRY